MKDKRFKFIFEFVCIFLLVLIYLTQTTFAWTPDWNAVENHTAGNTGNAVYSVMGSVINIVSIAGAGIAIIMLIWLAIRYLNTYHPTEKAEVKKQLPVYITGAVILFSASALLKIIQMFVESNINNI